MTKFNEKTLFLGYFASFFTKFAQKQTFPGKKGSAIFEIFQLSTTCKKSEKTNEPFLRKEWRADRYTTVILKDPPWDEGPIKDYAGEDFYKVT